MSPEQTQHCPYCGGKPTANEIACHSHRDLLTLDPYMTASNRRREQ